MKTTLNTLQIANALKSDTNANWSYDGAMALAEYLEEMEESTGEEMELDVVAIRCDYSEYASLQEWAAEYYGSSEKAAVNFGWDEDTNDEEKDSDIRIEIRDGGQLVEFDGGVIVSGF